MALKCKLDKNITLGSCRASEIFAGIAGTFFVYNIDDVENLIYINDDRYDGTLYIDQVLSKQPFYKVDASEVTYTQKQNGDIFSHQLVAVLPNSAVVTEDILSDAKNSRYLVAFRAKGADDYRMFGQEKGALLSFTSQMSNNDTNYTLTFSDDSEYPLLSLNKDNFDPINKVFEPLFEPILDSCEIESSYKNGYLYANYVVKVNAAGQALDSDNKLCIYSGKKQDAYRLQNYMPMEEVYNVIGTFEKGKEFNGKPTRIFSPEQCAITDPDSLILSNSHLSLSSRHYGAVVILRSKQAWRMVKGPEIVSISPTQGNGGGGNNFLAVLNAVKQGGQDEIIFENVYSKVKRTLIVDSYFIKVDDRYTYPMNTLGGRIYPLVQGGDGNYSLSCNRQIDFEINDDGSFNWTVEDSEYGEWVVTISHNDFPDESKVFTIFIEEPDREPKWEVIDKSCQIVQGHQNGYVAITLRDNNPFSYTYGDTLVNYEIDLTICPSDEPVYKVTKTFCELDDRGAQNGNKVYIYTDVNPNSPSYGEEYDDVQPSPDCPPSSTRADYQLVRQYCEKTTYGTADQQIEGNSGVYIYVFEDVNPFSDTFGDTYEERSEEFGRCPKPDSFPDWHEIARSCDLNVDGQENVSYMDINRYSSTYLTTKIEPEENDKCKAISTEPRWLEVAQECQINAQGQNTGYLIITLRDVNQYSPTYNQSRQRLELNTGVCPTGAQRSININLRNNGRFDIFSVLINFRGLRNYLAWNGTLVSGDQVNVTFNLDDDADTLEIADGYVADERKEFELIDYGYRTVPEQYSYEEQQGGTLTIYLGR